MSIQDSKKPLLALSVLGLAGCLYLVIVYALATLSTWAEQDLNAYPFKQEDWLRYLLPSRFELDGKKSILLAGPSTVRENLRYERFEKEFPDYTILQGGISLGTIEDTTTALQYINRVYGPGALPQIVVLGISVRFIANIPAQRPFADGINRYSPFLSTLHDANGTRLVPKSAVNSIIARTRFFTNKQPERFRTAIIAVISHFLNEDESFTVLKNRINQLFRSPVITRFIAGSRFKRALAFDFTEVLAWLASPYKYSLDEPIELKGLVHWMNDPESWWQIVYQWNPEKTNGATRASLERLRDFVRKYNIRLVVVNMPERDISREKYKPENYQNYVRIVRETLGNDSFLDYREMLKPDEFHDLEHSIPSGSLRLTNAIIRDLKGRMTHDVAGQYSR